MDSIPRPRNTASGYFDLEYYYLRSDQECIGCPKAGKRPNEAHFHCRKCHTNLVVPRKDNISNRLKQHYINNPEKEPVRGKATIPHDLNDPPRPVGTDFESLTTHEKTLVREGTKDLFTAGFVLFITI